MFSKQIGGNSPTAVRVMAHIYFKSTTRIAACGSRCVLAADVDTGGNPFSVPIKFIEYPNGLGGLLFKKFNVVCG